LPKIVFRCKVFSGTGNGRKFVGLPWVKQQVQEKLGFSPYAGTLNIRLTEEGKKKKILLEKAKGMVVEPQAGYCPGIMFKACIGTLECAVVIPQIPNYPSAVLEIIAPVCLRDHLKLVDGSLVTVLVSV
jgi:riboflavin kinase